MSSKTSVSGAREASPMEGVTDTLAWLGHMPRCPRGGSRELGTVYFFRIPYLAEMEAACSVAGCHPGAEVPV